MSTHTDNVPQTTRNGLDALDVAELMKQLKLIPPKDTVTVRGTVKALRPWPKDNPKLMYGDLKDDADERSILSFRVPATSPLREEDHVVLSGTLEAKISRNHPGFDLELTGRRVDTWKPDEPRTMDQAPLERTSPKMTLERFVAENDVNSLWLIGTKTGRDDAKAVANRHNLQFQQGPPTSTELDSLLSAIAAASNNTACAGLCLVRGGGDPSWFSTWKEERLIRALLQAGKPFYTALGHAHDLTLADKHADESFVTPSDLGTACILAWQTRMKREARVEHLTRENRKLKAVVQSADKLELDKNVLLLQTTLAEFQKLPAALSRQTGQEVRSAIRASLQDEFKISMAQAVQGPVAKLTQVTEQARLVVAEALRKVRFHAWAWLFSVFLLGVLAGAFGLYSLGRSTAVGASHEPTGTQQLPPPGTKPPELKGSAGHRVH